MRKIMSIKVSRDNNNNGCENSPHLVHMTPVHCKHRKTVIIYIIIIINTLTAPR